MSIFLTFLYAFIIFEGENLNVVVREDGVYFKGVYFLKKGANRKVLLFYPVQETVDWVRLNGEKVQPLKGGFFITLNEGDSLFCVEFHTPKDTIFRYILLTTRRWRRPLEFFTLRVFIPECYSVDFLTLKPDSSIKIGGETIYLFNRKNFLPEEDLIFKISR